MERADDRLLFVENRNVFFDKNVSVDMIFIYVWNWMSATEKMRTSEWVRILVPGHVDIQIRIKFDFIKILYLSEERLR